MSSAYNSRLISSLYRETNQSKIKEILSEMEEIADPVFLDPIFDAYERFHHSFISHYFISSLKVFEGKEAIRIAVKILGRLNRKTSDLVWVLPIFTKNQYFKPEITDLYLKLLNNLALSDGNYGEITSSFELHWLLDYIKKANAGDLAVEPLRKIIEHPIIERDMRSSALYQLLRINSTIQLQYLVDNYDKRFKDTDTEILIAKELTISKWSGGKTEVLKKVILENGGDRAKEIIQKDIEAQKEKLEVTQKEEYLFVGAVTELSNLRVKINTLSHIADEIGFPLFNQNESLFNFQKAVRDESSLKVFCTDFRSLLSDLNNRISEHGFDTLDIKKLLPVSKPDDYNKPLNRLFLFLHSKKIKSDSTVFGFKELNWLFGVLGAHNEAKSEKIKALKHFSLEGLYAQGKWVDMQGIILDSYRKSLQLLVDSLRAKQDELKSVSK